MVGRGPAAGVRVAKASRRRPRLVPMPSGRRGRPPRPGPSSCAR